MTEPHREMNEQQAAALYAAHWPAVVDVAARKLGNLEEAEAVAQEALLRALDATQSGEVRHFRALAMRIAINLALDMMRRREWRAPREDPEHLVDTEVHREDRAALLRIREALDQLEPEQRKLIEMKYVEERSFSQIAEQLGMSKNGVFARHERALEALRASLSPPKRTR